MIRIRQIFASSQAATASGILACAGITFYVLWYATAGQFSYLLQIDNAHIDLAEAFLNGQWSLPDKPDPALIAAQDPYDPMQRNVPFLWDASYYRGQYYLYWGPVPALVFAVIKGATRVNPPGSLLVVLCYVGLPIILSLLFIQIRKYFFPLAPGFSVGLGTLMGCMSLPFLFLLGRPGVYETSIIAGQFFLFLGLLGLIMYMTHSDHARWLLVAGLSWGLAIGSRYNLAISIGVYLVFALMQIIRGTTGSQRQREIACLLIPLALCIVGLGIYNFARFGNPLETGITYQLSIPEDQEGRYSTSYVLVNLFSYLFYPLTTVNVFPFITFAAMTSPFDEFVAGLLPSTPGVWLLALAIPLLLLRKIPLPTPSDIPDGRASNTLAAMILVAALAQFLFLTTYFFAAMRFLADFYLQLALGIWLLVWQVDNFLQYRYTQALRVFFWFVVTALVLWTVGIGFFGSFDIPPQILRVSEPIFYTQTASYWNDRYTQLITSFKALGLFQ